MLRHEGDRLTRVVVCPPAGEYLRVTDPAAHGMNEPADPDRIGRQYEALREVLAGAGAEVVEVEELAGHPNSAFTRDTALVTPGGHSAAGGCSRRASSPASSPSRSTGTGPPAPM